MTTRGHSGDADGHVLHTLSDLVADVADRVRRLPESRLNRVAGPARELAQALANAAAGIEGRHDPAPPEGRPLPVLSVFALADQIAVTRHDLTAAAAGLDPVTPIWWGGVRQPLQDVLSALAARAERVRAET